jgi:membrane protease YdiL (CAAX protease family)
LKLPVSYWLEGVLKEIMSRLFQSHPLTSVVLVAVVTKVVMMAATIVVMTSLGGSVGTAAEAVVAILALGLIPLALYLAIRKTGMSRAVGFNRPGLWKEPWLIWLPALLVLVNLTGVLRSNLHLPADLSPLYNAAVQAISVPLIEEFAFRGLILAILLAQCSGSTRDVRRAVFISSALFGLWHLPTIAYNPIVGIGNVIYAAFAGVGFAAVVLRTRTIWLVLVVHMVIVFTSVVTGVMISGTPVAAGTLVLPEQAWLSATKSVAALVPILLYGIWLLRNPISLNMSEPSKSGK